MERADPDLYATHPHLYETPLAWSPAEIAATDFDGMSRRQLVYLVAQSNAVAARAQQRLAFLPREDAPDRFMRLDEVAQLLRVSAYTLETQRSTTYGQLVRKENGRLGVWRSDFDAYVSKAKGGGHARR